MQEEIKKCPSLMVCEGSVEDVLICSSEGKEHPEITGVILGSMEYTDLLLNNNLIVYNRVW